MHKTRAQVSKAFFLILVGSAQSRHHRVSSVMLRPSVRPSVRALPSRKMRKTRAQVSKAFVLILATH